jgi:hypothetical protein
MMYYIELAKHDVRDTLCVHDVPQMRRTDGQQGSPIWPLENFINWLGCHI